MVKTAEQFPDFDEMDDVGGGKGKGKGKSKNKKVRNVVKQEVSPEEDVNLTPYKGNPSSFFVMEQNLEHSNDTNPFGYSLNNDQWSFIFLHYPEYAQAPYEMMSWLFG